MSKEREALKLALEALKQIDEAMPFPVAKFAQAAIREALAEQPAQQQESVDLEAVYETIIRWDIGGGKRSRRELARRIVALYTSPPVSKPLTDEQIMEMYNEPRSDAEMIEFARAIEAAHGIKGSA